VTTFHDEPHTSVTRPPRRAAHVGFGTGWRSDDHPDIDWQVRWLPETGELWAVDEDDEGHGILLGRIEDRSDVDAALAGWDKPGVARDLAWAMTRVDALTRGLDSRSTRLAAWQDRLVSWEQSLADGDRDRVWSLPAATVADVLAEFRRDFGDEDIDTFSTGFGLDAGLVDGLLSGRIDTLDVTDIAQVCEALNCSPFDLWEPAEARSILHAYRPELWPTTILPLDGRPAPPLPEHMFMARRLDQQAAEIEHALRHPAFPVDLTANTGHLHDETDRRLGPDTVAVTVYDRTGTLAVTDQGQVLALADDTPPPDNVGIEEYHLQFQQTADPIRLDPHRQISVATVAANPPAGLAVHPSVASAAEHIRHTHPDRSVDLVRFTTPNGPDAWVGWDPAEGWSTWDDPRTHFTAGAPELVLDPAGHINPDALDVDTFTELEVEPEPPQLRLASEPFDPRLQL